MDDRPRIQLVHDARRLANPPARVMTGAVGVRIARAQPRVVDGLGEVARNLAVSFAPLPHPEADGDAAGAGASLDLAALAKALSGHDISPLLPEPLRRAVRPRQVAWLGGRLCAERALEQLGAAEAGVPRGAHGEPVWPPGFAGSITHTDAIACALAARRADQAGLGIDSERLVGDDARHAIESVCCTAGERDAWLRGPDSRWRTTLLFAAKEAFYKAAWPAVRRFVDFDEAWVDDWDPAACTLTLRLGPTLAPAAVVARYVVDEPLATAHVRVTLPPSLVGRLAGSGR